VNRLREERVIRRITQYQLKILTGINPAAISLIERGLMQAREDQKEKIARVLGVNKDEIWGD
jgi:transcriptional regulator with XRE-family HTH domain